MKNILQFAGCVLFWVAGLCLGHDCTEMPAGNQAEIFGAAAMLSIGTGLYMAGRIKWQ